MGLKIHHRVPFYPCRSCHQLVQQKTTNCGSFKHRSRYIAACTAAQETMYLRALLVDLHYLQIGPTILHQDNQEAITLGSDNISNRRTKHIDIKFPFIREKVEDGIIRLLYTPTAEMIADCLTKPVGKQILNRARAQIFGGS